jgi:hypothetical protein
MSLEHVFGLKPIWEWTTGDLFISIGIAISCIVIRHILYFWYTFKIAESQHEKKLCKFQQVCKSFWVKWGKFL